MRWRLQWWGVCLWRRGWRWWGGTGLEKSLWCFHRVNLVWELISGWVSFCPKAIGVTGTGFHFERIGEISIGLRYLSVGFLVVSQIMIEDLIYVNFVFVHYKQFLWEEVSWWVLSVDFWEVSLIGNGFFVHVSPIVVAVPYWPEPDSMSCYRFWRHSVCQANASSDSRSSPHTVLPIPAIWTPTESPPLCSVMHWIWSIGFGWCGGAGPDTWIWFVGKSRQDWGKCFSMAGVTLFGVWVMRLTISVGMIAQCVIFVLCTEVVNCYGLGQLHLYEIG